MEQMDYMTFLQQKIVKMEDSGFKSKGSNPLLFDFQNRIVEWATLKGRSAIFAGCGLGKTAIQLEWASGVAEHTGEPVLLLAPLAVSHQTVMESLKFNIPNVHIVQDQNQIKHGVNITNYEKIHKFNAESFSGVVLDESSILKGLDSKTRELLTTSFTHTPYKLACSATPAPNDFMELGSHSEFLNIMSRAEMLAMFFTHDGGNTSKWRLNGHSRHKFWAWVASWAVVVRAPSDIGYPDDGYILPPCEITTEIVEMERDEGALFAIEAVSLNDQRASKRKSLADRVSKCAEMVNSNNDQWIVWCELNDESTALKNAIPEAVEVRGSDTNEHKESALIGFSEGIHRVIVTKPSIAGHGMNWQNCHKIAFCGLSHSYEQFYQAIRRCWRFGQQHPVNVHVVIGEKERPILDNVSRKEKDAEKLWEGVVAVMQGGVSDVMKKHVAEYAETSATGSGWEIIHGDCVEAVGKMPDESVHFSVFSPPFASLYTYSDSERDMGNNKTYDEFEQHFKFLIRELHRVLKPGRNISIHCMNLPLSKQSYGEISIRDFRGDIIRWFQDAGFVFHSEVCIWKDPVIAMQRTKALGLLWKQLRKDSTMSRQGVPDYLVTMRKPGVNPEPVTHTKESFPVDQWQKWASPVWDDINPSDTLQYLSARDESDERHICPLQLQVIERAICLWSNPGDTVLTPFAGIGSEVYQAVKFGRRGIGVELKKSYFDLAVRNLMTLEESSKQIGLFDGEATA